MKQYEVVNECGEVHDTFPTRAEAEAEQRVCEKHMEEGQSWNVEEIHTIDPTETNQEDSK